MSRLEREPRPPRGLAKFRRRQLSEIRRGISGPEQPALSDKTDQRQQELRRRFLPFYPPDRKVGGVLTDKEQLELLVDRAYGYKIIEESLPQKVLVPETVLEIVEMVWRERKVGRLSDAECSSALRQLFNILDQKEPLVLQILEANDDEGLTPLIRTRIAVTGDRRVRGFYAKR